MSERGEETTVESVETVAVTTPATTEITETTPASAGGDNLGKVRDLVLKAHPDVVPDLVRGNSVDELIASVEPARSAYQRIADQVRGSGTETTVPGPAVLYIIDRGIDQGRLAGLASAAGIATGSFVHVVAAALGLSAILASSALAFSVVKYLGAAYLIYLGVRTLLTQPGTTAPIDRRPRSTRELFRQGVVVQILNPKIALFFLAFLPQFVEPARGSVAMQTLFLGGLLMVMGLCTDSLYAPISGSAGDWLKQQSAFASAQRYVAGVVFIGLGLTTALSGGKSK